jgi:hypothetical protein
MFNVKPELMFNWLAVPGAVPAPTVKEFVDALKVALAFSSTGLLAVLPMVTTADVLLGTPADQFVEVDQSLDVVPVQLSAACAVTGMNARIAVAGSAGPTIAVLNNRMLW